MSSKARVEEFVRQQKAKASLNDNLPRERPTWIKQLIAWGSAALIGVGYGYLGAQWAAILDTATVMVTGVPWLGTMMYIVNMLATIIGAISSAALAWGFVMEDGPSKVTSVVRDWFKRDNVEVLDPEPVMH